MNACLYDRAEPLCYISIFPFLSPLVGLNPLVVELPCCCNNINHHSPLCFPCGSHLPSPPCPVLHPLSPLTPGTFHTTDRVSTLRKFVQDSLADEGRAFYLYTHPDRNKVENANETLREAGLVPLRLLNFGWADGEVSKAPVIKQSLLDAIQPLA